MEALKLLKAEIQNKRKLLNELGIIEPEKKYFKQSELLEKLEAPVKEEQKPSSSEIKEGKDDVKKDAQLERYHALSRKEISRRLREFSVPVRYFGESDDQVILRLKELEANSDESVKGMRNDFQEALQKVDDDYLKELESGADASSSSVSGEKFDVKVTTAPEITLDDLAKEAEGKFNKGDSEYDIKFMIRVFKTIIAAWARELNERPVEEKESQQGRLDTAIHTQTVEYMKPFLKRYNDKSKYSKRDLLGMDLIESIVDVVKFLIAKNYLKAHENLLLCAVGNA